MFKSELSVLLLKPASFQPSPTKLVAILLFPQSKRESLDSLWFPFFLRSHPCCHQILFILPSKYIQNVVTLSTSKLFQVKVTITLHLG